MRIKVKHINGLRSAKAKISEESGDLSHDLTFNVLLAHGDLERLLQMFRQQIPVEMEIYSLQSKFDLIFEMVYDKPENVALVDPVAVLETQELAALGKENPQEKVKARK